MRDLIGVNLVKGIGVGIDVESPNLQKDIDSNMSDLVAKMQSTVNYETAMTKASLLLIITLQEFQVLLKI